MKRSMKNTFEGRTFYESTFDSTSGVLVREVEARPRGRYQRDDLLDLLMHGLQYEKRDAFRESWEALYGFRREPFSPSPETVDVSITDWCDFGCTYCLELDTPVLAADLQWRPIGQRSVGEVLVGFDEHPTSPRSFRKFRPSVIEAITYSKRPAFRIVTARREILSTGNHGWLRKSAAGMHFWNPTDRLKVGQFLSYGVDPFAEYEVSEDYRVGYLAAMTLGDGTWRFEPGWRNWSQGFPQAYWRVALKDEDALGRIVAYLAWFGIESHIRPFDGGPSCKTGMQKVEIRAINRLEKLFPILRSVIDSDEYRRGWLAGFFDAEGSHYGNLRFSQKKLEPLERTIRYGASLGFVLKLELNKDPENASTVRLVGSVWDRIKFLGVIRPAISRKTTDWMVTAFETKPEEILAIEPAGLVDVADIQTSTSTFFADGLATHNCYQDSTAKQRHAPNDLVDKVIKSFTHPPYQIAIGGGEPTAHPDFPNILMRARELGTVPNYTTAGHIVRPEVVEATNQVCGGVAMTFHAWKGVEWFKEHYTKLRSVLKVQLNVHLIADKDVATNLEALTALQRDVGKLNVVLLAYYPDVGRGTMAGIMPKPVYSGTFPLAITRAIASKMTLAFSEGLLPYFLSRPELGVETKFASRAEGLFSAYVDPRGRMSYSSFDPPPKLTDKPPRWKEETDEVYEKRVKDNFESYPTAWNGSLQGQWNKLRSWHHEPHGGTCYDCKLRDSCSTPNIHHYFACAYASHNGNNPPLNADAQAQQDEMLLIREMIAAEKALGREMTEDERVPWQKRFRAFRNFEED